MTTHTPWAIGTKHQLTNGPCYASGSPILFQNKRHNTLSLAGSWHIHVPASVSESECLNFIIYLGTWTFQSPVSNTSSHSTSGPDHLPSSIVSSQFPHPAYLDSHFKMAAQQTVDSQSTASSTEEQLVSPRTSAQQDEKLPPQQQPSASHSLRFWGIFVALCILSFICALDVIIITTALPTITASIGGAKQYVWIANSFVIASSVLQLLFGQLADIFGRKTPLIASSALFILGSGLAGGASNAAGLIAGRTVQGVGAGGLYVLLDIVCCDLVPLRERGKYVGLMNSFAGVAAAIGPAIGGAIAQAK